MSKILLVEDDATMRALLKTLLELDGHRVILVTELNQDIPQSIKNQHPDIVIMDVNLRHNNGIEILRQIRQQDLGWKLNVFMTSGSDYREECKKAGADGFLMKPLMPAELSKLIKLAQSS